MNKSFFLLLTAAIFFLASCGTKGTNTYNIVPFPNSILPAPGHFTFTPETNIILPQQADEAVYAVAKQFAGQFEKTSGITLLQITSDNPNPQKQAINFVNDKHIVKEGYVLDIEKDRIIIKASEAIGFFYAVQSLKQLLPRAVYGNTIADEKWNVPCVAINDSPRFKYRGMHLDVCRHFFSKEEVKRYIDVLAIHKINYFHWHLTDDQGWRVEIKKYPKLTEIGSIRSKTMIGKDLNSFDNTPHSGFYTQDEIREIVAYAAERFITIIPEIDLPGHTMAVLASYPHLGCTGGPYEVSGQWWGMEDVLCVGKESTFTFLEDVFTEIVDMFPSTYIHIGGDECPKGRWAECRHCQAKIKQLGLKTDDRFTAEHYLQSYTTARVERFLNERGRQIIGWDEILEGELAPNATVMSWRGIAGGLEAAQKNHDVIMTPTSHMYFDFYQSTDMEKEPLAIGGYLSVKKVYSFEPIPEKLAADKHSYIIGVQANLWTEYIKTNQHLEYMLLPRLAALSEVQWTQAAQKDWSRFLRGIEHITGIYETMGYNYAKHVFEITGNYSINPDKPEVLVAFEAQGNSPIYYTIDDGAKTLYKRPVGINKSSILKAVVEKEGVQDYSYEQEFRFHKATGHKAMLHTSPNIQYASTGAPVLVDGIRGDDNFSTGLWLGFFEEPLEASIAFHEATEISTIKVGTLSAAADWVFPPSGIRIEVSEDGETFKEIVNQEVPELEEAGGKIRILKDYTYTFSPVLAKEIKVFVSPVKSIPAWHQGRGGAAYIFVDEIVVE